MSETTQPITGFDFERAERAFAVAETAQPTDAIPSAICQLVELIDPQATSLDSEQVEAVKIGIYRLLSLHDRAEAGERPEVVVRGLYDAYFVNDRTLGKTPADSIFRFIGDKFSRQQGYDFEWFWEIYLDSINAAGKRAT